MSLVDALAPADDLIKTASIWALDIVKGRKPWITSLYRTDRLEPLKEARLILNTARAQSRKQNPNLTHPLICIDVIEEGIVSGPRNALWKVLPFVVAWIIVTKSWNIKQEFLWW